jgi:hypothetical protein
MFSLKLSGMKELFTRYIGIIACYLKRAQTIANSTLAMIAIPAKKCGDNPELSAFVIRT